MARAARIRRTTRETDIGLELDLDNATPAEIATGHGFLDHLLQQLARHGRFGLKIEASGDLEVDVHHLAEDTGICLGAALSEALGDRTGIERYGDALLPMDETLAQVALDLSGRPLLAFDPTGFEGVVHGFHCHHLRELLRGFCNHGGVTLHVRVLAGQETHHVCEAVTKAWSVALRKACRLGGSGLPSTKGML